MLFEVAGSSCILDFIAKLAPNPGKEIIIIDERMEFCNDMTDTVPALEDATEAMSLTMRSSSSTSSRPDGKEVETLETTLTFTQRLALDKQLQLLDLNSPAPELPLVTCQIV
jgi:hypothetical protein